MALFLTPWSPLIVVPKAAQSQPLPCRATWYSGDVQRAHLFPLEGYCLQVCGRSASARTQAVLHAPPSHSHTRDLLYASTNFIQSSVQIALVQLEKHSPCSQWGDGASWGSVLGVVDICPATLKIIMEDLPVMVQHLWSSSRALESCWESDEGKEPLLRETGNNGYFPASMGPSIDVWHSPLRVCSSCRIAGKEMLVLDYRTCLKLDSSRYFAPSLECLCSLFPPYYNLPCQRNKTLCMERRQKGKKKKKVFLRCVSTALCVKANSSVFNRILLNLSHTHSFSFIFIIF